MKRWLVTAGLLLAAPGCPAQSLAARLQWASPMELSSPASGVVREVLVSPRDRVAPGLAAFDEDGARQYSIEVEFDRPAQRNWRAGQPAEILLP